MGEDQGEGDSYFPLTLTLSLQGRENTSISSPSTAGGFSQSSPLPRRERTKVRVIPDGGVGMD